MTVQGTLANPSHRLLTPPPPLHAMPRSKTGRKPQRSSPLAGPALSVTDSEDIPSRMRVSSSPSLNRDFNNNTLLPPTPCHIVSSGLTRPKSMYSTLSSHPQSFTPPQDRSYESLPATKQPIRPISAVLPLTATRMHFSDRHSTQTAGDLQNLGEQTYSGYNRIPPSTRTAGKHVSPSTGPHKPLPTITQSIEDPQTLIPSPSGSTETTVPRDNSWYTTNPYEETPKFSRSGLGADSVVMPVSAKGYNKRWSENPTSVDSSDSLTANAATGNRPRTLLMGSIGSTLRLTRSNPNLASSAHQSAQEPSPSSSFSSRSSSIFPHSDSAPSTTSRFTPDSSLYRTRTNSFSRTSSSSSSSSLSSTYTLFMHDITSSSSRTSVNEETIQESSPSPSPPPSPTVIVYGKDIHHCAEKIASGGGKEDQTRKTNPSVSEKSPRRGGTFRRFIRLFVST